MQVQHHVGSAVADFGIGMSRQIVEKFGDILGGLVGGLGLTRINCADGRKNDSINGTDIVEVDDDDLLNVIDTYGVKGLGEV